MLSFNSKMKSSLLVNILDIQVGIALQDIQNIGALSPQQLIYRQSIRTLTMTLNTIPS